MEKNTMCFGTEAKRESFLLEVLEDTIRISV
jgi:hypothetical protein